MSELILSLRQAGFSELACQFAKFIQRLDKTGDNLIALTAALVSDANTQGHVCLNLDQAAGIEAFNALDLPERQSDWVKRLQQSHVVGASGDYAPLILTNTGLLYLYRYWLDEQHVAITIRQRCQSIEVINPKQLQHDFTNWQSDIDGIDWQKVAVLMALTRQFTVISGGPGTGKTTIVLRLLQILLNQDPSLKIALAAPTGKAAARLQQTVMESELSSFEAKTLHRLLGITSANDNGRYNSQRPLAIDVLIVDEASMVDISLMAKLMQALPDKARLILLGDSQQLASVESGAVLANLCSQPAQFSKEFTHALQQLAGTSLESAAGDASVLTDSVVTLQHSYRFDEQSDIGKLARAVQSGDEQKVFSTLTTSKLPLWQQQLDPASIQNQVFEAYQPYFDTVKNSDDTLKILKLFEQYRVLCALKQGHQSVASVNELIERALQRQGWRTNHNFYLGRPIMVTQNDYRQRLFNGDTGLILNDEMGQLRACFLFENTVRWIDLTRLPAHETAFAITIHKSQGSEFDTASILLPEESSRILNRELLYTAITRVRKSLNIIATENILRHTIFNYYQRETGLREQLENSTE
jgi:exodeoxyribonuclease V alpha subunit